MAYQQSQYSRASFDSEQILWAAPYASMFDEIMSYGDSINYYVSWNTNFPVEDENDSSSYSMPMPPPMPTIETANCFGGFGQPLAYLQQQHNVMESSMDDRMDRGGSFSGSSASGDTPYSGGSNTQMETRSNSVESFGSFGSGGDGPALRPTRGPILQATPSPEVAIAVHTHSHAHSYSHSHSHSHKRRLPSSSASSSASSRGSISSTRAATISPVSKATRGVEELAPRDKTRRIRKKFSHDQKIETHMTRLEGACLRCWKNRKRCVKIEGACCKYCSNLNPMPDMPCFRARLSSSELFRQGPTDEFRWTQRKWLQTPFNDTKVWRSPQTRLFVTQGMGLRLELVVKKYEPQPEDTDKYFWTDCSNGAKKSLKMPRYAVADISGAQDAINRYVGDHTESYIKKKIGSEETIPWKTFQMALKISNEGSSLLRNALRLWTASRIIEDPWEITGSEKLGMQPDSDPKSPYYRKVPVTPVMDFQIDNITICRILLPLKKQILQELQKKVLENRPKDFMEIFLTMYILLHNIELTIAHDRWFAQRWNIKTRFSHYQLIDNVFFGANIMLTHFHHVTRGYGRFAQDWKKSIPDKPTETHRRFMDEISTAAKHQAGSLQILRDTAQYESPMFWCSQLFYDGWKPVVSPCA